MFNQVESVYKPATGLTKINENRYFVGLASSFVFEHLDSLPPLVTSMPFIYDVCNGKIHLYAKEFD